MLLFAGLSACVFTGSAATADQWLFLHFPRDPRFDPAARALTSLGSNAFMIAIAMAAAAAALRRAGKFAALPPIVAAGGVLIQNLLKLAFHRPRPELLPRAIDVSGWSYPSGHAMMSALGYFFLAAFLVRFFGWRRAIVFPAAAILTLAIGLTRVYFAVHWPSDVVGGWLIGIACAECALRFCR